MSCPECPHCQAKKGVPKGGLTLQSSGPEKPEIKQKEIETPFSVVPKSSVRGKAREYSAFFEQAWKAYGRKEQKFEAYSVWLLRSKEIGGEPLLMDLVLKGLKWQGPIWGADGWKFAPYFERYLKRRKWEDEPGPVATAPTRAPLLSWDDQRKRDAQAEAERLLAQRKATVARDLETEQRARERMAGR